VAEIIDERVRLVGFAGQRGVRMAVIVSEQKPTGPSAIRQFKHSESP
jgi:hypothetical protein